ncbi:alpha-amylase family glycosyl hydrolase [Mucisphaera calidilacus]|uniref:Alpha-amylase n=1 Tax=Mucisphaera calidilacus TaxID=2527982 RepID=A0A518BVD6_9BACT|nr:alpha-amylase family glycosyl hydrolase [Mucisphaera calidilacus]QDU70939.1 Alpha-amylase precursor [Mucisphaera calidilacus]
MFESLQRLSLFPVVVIAISLVAETDRARAMDVSSEPILQFFEQDWTVIDERMSDIFVVGYGRLWLPPPARADSGGLSVGYDVFDRFDLGTPGNPTLYGTEGELKTLIDTAHRAGIKVNTDFIANHNGFSDSSTPGFVAAGDYPGFVTTLPNDVDGDFHSAFAGGERDFRLSGLIDIDQSKNHQFIRHPVTEGDPLNIPAGSFHDRPDPRNAQFYPDRDLGGTTVWDPALNQNVTLYNYNLADPMQGDAFTENATGLLMRNLRWMIQEVGVDGFRFDAVRHFDPWVMNFLDQGMYLANPRKNLDGSHDHVFSFSETGFDSAGFIQQYIRKDIDNDNLGQLGGNRDALDFNFFGAVKNNLSDNGLANDWRNVKNASVDGNDDGYANNGSQGTRFVQSHDEGGAYLNSVAHAYMLMLPGEAIVYFNGEKVADGFRAFPEPGRGDALGGVYGEDITTLVGIRNTHGRGNYLDRTPGGDEKEMLIYERENSALVVLSNRLDGGFDSRTVQTAFEPGTPLIELTGNAADPVFDPGNNDFPSLLVVKDDGTVDLRVPRNVAPGENGVEHGRGYLIYGVSGPQGVMQFMEPDGEGGYAAITDVLAGSVPTLGDDELQNDRLNGLTRLTDITVVTADTFKIQIDTNPVTLLGIHRDRDADGDAAIFRIDDGLDANGNGYVDNVTPGEVTYAFESFTDVNLPGYSDASGVGRYEQIIDTSLLGEGEHTITGRVFRRRNGDEPEVFTDFRQVIYIDREAPEVSFESFEALEEDYARDRQLVLRSEDGTANSVHVFFNVAANITDQQILDAVSGSNAASLLDRNLWARNLTDVVSGKHKVTVVTYEVTGSMSIQHLTGIELDTGFGLGIGDLDSDGVFEARDVELMEIYLSSDNGFFRAAGDGNGDGRLDLRDLTPLGDALAGGPQEALDAYDDLIGRALTIGLPGDLNLDGDFDLTDVDLLLDELGDAVFDYTGDGVSDTADVTYLIEVIGGTFMGDANLDGSVDLLDLSSLASRFGDPASSWSEGDFDGNNVVDLLDLSILASNFGRANGIPEPTTALVLLVLGSALRRRAA